MTLHPRGCANCGKPKVLDLSPRAERILKMHGEAVVARCKCKRLVIVGDVAGVLATSAPLRASADEVPHEALPSS